MRGFPLLAAVLALAVGCAGDRGQGATPVPSRFAVGRIQRGDYREARAAVGHVDLVAVDGSRDRVMTPTTRGGSQERFDVLTAARQAGLPVVQVPE